jgi:hypothetical protein
MARSLAVALILSCIAGSAWAQAQPAPGAATAQTGTPSIEPAAKKPAQKSKAAAKPTVPADNGACDIGVIAAAGSRIVLQKVGITVFGNEETEVPSDAWGIDDLIFARVRAAAGPRVAVRRITYAKEAFESYDHPEKRIIKDARENFTAIVRQVAAKSRCARYIAVVRYVGNLSGTNQSLAGVGVLAHGPFKVFAFAYTRVVVFDGETFAIREDPFGSFGARMSAALSGMMQQEYMRAVDIDFPASPEEAARNAKLRDTARALVAERLDRILPEYLKQ